MGLAQFFDATHLENEETPFLEVNCFNDKGDEVEAEVEGGEVEEGSQ